MCVDSWADKRERKLEINLDAWQDRRQCPEFGNCLDFSNAKLEMQRTLQDLP
jgi:hypothetical protein